MSVLEVFFKVEFWTENFELLPSFVSWKMTITLLLEGTHSGQDDNKYEFFSNVHIPFLSHFVLYICVYTYVGIDQRYVHVYT